jgi:predicted ArsR family transcriptional regulator
MTELAQAAEVHVNTIRSHLAALEAAGVLAYQPRPATGPGRPAGEYILQPEWTRGLTDFFSLAELLAAAVARSGLDKDELVSLGNDWGRFLVGRPERRDPSHEIPRALERLGYQASVSGEQVHLVGCPCPLLLEHDPRIICALARGVIDGVLSASGSELRIVEHRHRPERRNCITTLGKPEAPGRSRRQRQR